MYTYIHFRYIIGGKKTLLKKLFTFGIELGQPKVYPIIYRKCVYTYIYIYIYGLAVPAPHDGAREVQRPDGRHGLYYYYILLKNITGTIITITITLYVYLL